MCTDTDMATGMFILIGPCSDLCRTVQVNRWACPFFSLLLVPFSTIFFQTLSYSSHVNYLKTNCLKALDILKVVGHTDWGADQKTLLCLY